MSHHKHELDAAGAHPGRLATQIAHLLQGKHKATFTPNIDNGDKVVIVNADKIAYTGKKIDQVIFRHHSMHPGGLKETPVKRVMAEDPREVIIHTVQKMLPKNKFRTNRLKRLTFK